MRIFTRSFVFAVFAGCTAACSGTGTEPAVPTDATPATAAPVPAERSRDLPFAQGRHFGSLDAYLAHLEERCKTGVPWYREIKPGRYELVSRRGPGAAPRYYTREELLRKFGFTEP